MNEYSKAAKKFAMYFVIIFLVLFMFIILPKSLLNDEPWAENFTKICGTVGVYFVYIITGVDAILAIVFTVLSFIHKNDVSYPKNIDEMNDEWMMKLVHRLSEMGVILYLSQTSDHDTSSDVEYINKSGSSEDDEDEDKFLDDEDEFGDY